MSNTITFELSAEDRARLDRLAEALEKFIGNPCIPPQEEPSIEEEAIQLTIDNVPTSEPVRTVDRAELRAKVIELSAKGFKDQTKDIVRAYAQTVTTIPEDKIAECYEKLIALEV